MSRVHVPQTARPPATSPSDDVRKAVLGPSAPGYGGVLFVPGGSSRVPAQLPFPINRPKKGVPVVHGNALDQMMAMPAQGQEQKSAVMSATDHPINTEWDVVKGLPSELATPLALLVKEQISGKDLARARATFGDALVKAKINPLVHGVLQQRFQQLQVKSAKVVVVPRSPSQGRSAMNKAFAVLEQLEPHAFPEDFIGFANDLSKSGYEDFAADLLLKGASHKYLKREGSPGSYRYHYAITASSTNAKDAKVGDKFKMASSESGTKGHYEVTHDHGDGKVTIRHDETGATSKLSRDELHAHVASEHKATHTKAASQAMVGWERANKKGDHKTAAKFADAAAKHFGRVEEGDAGMGGKKLSDHWKSVAEKHKAEGLPFAKPGDVKEVPGKPPASAASSGSYSSGKPEDSSTASTKSGVDQAADAAKAHQAYGAHLQSFSDATAGDPKKAAAFHETAAALADAHAKASGLAGPKGRADRHREKAATFGALVKDAPAPAEGYGPKRKAAEKASAEAKTPAQHQAAGAAHEAAAKEAGKFGNPDAKLAAKAHAKKAEGHKQQAKAAIGASKEATALTAKASDAKGHLAAAEAHAKAAEAHGGAESEIGKLHQSQAANHVTQAQAKMASDEAIPKQSGPAHELSKKAAASGKWEDHRDAHLAHQEAGVAAGMSGNKDLAALHGELSEGHKAEAVKGVLPAKVKAAQEARKKALTENTHEAHAAAHKAISEVVGHMKSNAAQAAAPVGKGKDGKPGAKGPPGAPPAADPNIDALQKVADQHYADAMFLKQHDPKVSTAEKASLGGSHVKQPTVPASREAQVKHHTAQTKYEKPDGKVKLQGHGEVDGVKVKNLKPGTIAHWNQTHPDGEHVITKVESSGNKHTIHEKNLKTGATFTRKKQGDTLVGVHKGHFKKAG